MSLLSRAGPDGIMLPDGGTYARQLQNKRITTVRGKPGSSEDILLQLMRWGTLDRNRWEERNARFQRDQELYQLKTPDTVTAQVKQDVLILNDPKVLVKKLARLIARHPNVIDVPASPGTSGLSAQIIENWCYLLDQGINQRWMLSLHNPYRYDQAFFTCLRGWLCERTMLRDDPDEEDQDPMALFQHQVFDPVNIYPYAAADEIRRITHYYWTTAAEIRDDPFFQDAAYYWDTCPDDTNVHIYAWYWKDAGSWWHAVACDGGVSARDGSIWVKEPTELGYNPWTITLATGSAYGRTPWDDFDYLKEVGTGCLDDSVDTFTYLNRVATKLNELLSLESNPPASLYLQNGQIKPVSFRAGARNFFGQKDKVELHRVGPQPGDYNLLWEILQTRASRAGLPPAFFAEYGGETGFSASVIMAAGKDILFPFVEAINQADALKYRKFLEIYRDFGSGKPLRSMMPPNAMGAVETANLTADMIREQGTFVTVTREDMTPQETIARINSGLAQLQAKAISLKRFRREYAKIRNPDAENLDVLAEQVYLNEDVVKQLIPMALTTQGQDQLRQVWEMVQNPMPGMPGTQPQGGPPGMPPQGGPPQGGPPPGPPQGPPGMPTGPGAPPPPGPGLPTQALPPVMQTGNPLTNTQVPPGFAQLNQMLGMLNGGAQGGSGAGGVPPPGGQGSPIPLFLPPGRR